jgi:hypothetical protein
MFAPYLMPGEFEATTPPNAQPPVGMMDMGGMMSVIAQPHISFAGWIVALLGLKFFTESDLISVDVSEVKVSLLNILSITLQAGVGIIGLKVFIGWLLQKGVMIPGLADFIGAL